MEWLIIVFAVAFACLMAELTKCGTCGHYRAERMRCLCWLRDSRREPSDDSQGRY